MNQGKIWLVVKPTVGLPAFLGGVAIIALCVHAAILTKTDWYPAYYSGNAKAKPAAAAAADLPANKPVAAAAADSTAPAAAAPQAVALAKAAPDTAR